MINDFETFISHHRDQITPSCQADLRVLFAQVESDRALFKALMRAIHASATRLAASELAMIASLSAADSPLYQLLTSSMALSRENRERMSLADLYIACDRVSEAIANLKGDSNGR